MRIYIQGSTSGKCLISGFKSRHMNTSCDIIFGDIYHFQSTTLHISNETTYRVANSAILSFLILQLTSFLSSLHELN